MPLEVRLDVQAPGAGRKPVGLYDARISPGSMNPYCGAQRTRLERLDPLHSADLLAFLLVGLVDVPGVPLAGFVDVGPQLIAASFEDVPSHRFVENPLEST